MHKLLFELEEYSCIFSMQMLRMCGKITKDPGDGVGSWVN